MMERLAINPAQSTGSKLNFYVLLIGCNVVSNESYKFHIIAITVN